MKLTHEKKLCLLCDIIETFEDFLEDKGIDIPNIEKEDNPEGAANIYGTDYGNLETEIADILVHYGLFEEGV